MLGSLPPLASINITTEDGGVVMSNLIASAKHPLFGIMIITLLIGCTAAPKKIEDIEIAASPDIQIPVDGIIIIDMKEQDRLKKYQVNNGFNRWTLEEGELIHSAAMKMFGRLFNDVYSSEDEREGNLIVKVGGHGNINVFWGTYTVDATALVTKPSGETIGRYRSDGKAASGMVNDSIAFENAYIDAFSKIVSQILQDTKFKAYVDSGMEMSVARSAPPESQKSRKEGSSGSGFYINDNGFILTNHHVIDGCEQLFEVGNGNKTPLRIIASDSANDLAILKSDRDVKNYARFRSGKGIRPGDDVTVVGFPLKGLLSSSATSTFGSVNALAGLGNDSRLFQISAPVQPGNSGGPVLDNSGNIVGVVVAKLNAVAIAQVTGDIPQNINFAINGAVAKAFLDAHGIDYEVAVSASAMPRTGVAERGIALTIPISCE